MIHPDGRTVETTLTPGGDQLAVMREHIDCRWVDCVALTDRIDMWLDDEGMFTKPVNPVATALARRYGLRWQGYHGPVLVCGATREGDSVDLTTEQLAALLTHLHDLTAPGTRHHR